VLALDVKGKPVGFAGPFVFQKPEPPDWLQNGQREKRGHDTTTGGGTGCAGSGAPPDLPGDPGDPQPGQ